MPQDIRIWDVHPRDNLQEVKKAKLDLEKRLQDWLESDISIISNDFLVIGREVETDYGGFIDLLCLDRAGDVVVIELKRNKTPREVTAQTLDYASWVKDLSNEDITKIANSYLNSKFSLNLEETFAKTFDLELPETLNSNHKLLVVASQIDSSSERIIKYLSESYGVGINAVTFQYFRREDGSELLSRVFLIEPSQVERDVQIKGTSKRRPNPSYEELQEMAEHQGVGEIYKQIFKGLLEGHFSRTDRRTNAITFNGTCGAGKNAVIFSLILDESNLNNGLKFRVYTTRLSEYLGISEERIFSWLPENKKAWEYYSQATPDWCGYEGFFESSEEVSHFLKGLNEVRTNGSQNSNY
jgi:Endonuclease NucS